MSELDKARDIARRYRCEFVDLKNFQLHHDLFTKVPVHLMFRYNFVPVGGDPRRTPGNRDRRSQPANDDR